MKKVLRVSLIALVAIAWMGAASGDVGELQWVDARGQPTPDARVALSFLRGVDADGLAPEDFDAAALEAQANALALGGVAGSDAIRIFDSGLNANMIRYFRQLHAGRVDPRDVEFHLPVETTAENVEARLQFARVHHQIPHVIEELAPPFVQYRGLKLALAQYRASAPDSSAVHKIELAMERLRWLSELGSGRLLVVNIPMFRLWAFEKDRLDGMPSLDMGVIVGRAQTTRTPVFVSDMRSVVFRPFWNVPDSILRKEILPAVARDPRYLEKNDMEMIRSGDRVVVRQRPGPNNALGLVKFVFPNPYDVYMHGTPARELFARARRDFSHGCVRVEDPVALAGWALERNEGWNRARITAAMGGTETQTVNLASSIRVVLFYTTAVYMPADGTVRFAEDIYGYDASLERALKSRRRNAE